MCREQGSSLSDRWAEEFTEHTQQGIMKDSDTDFWDRLQKQWEDLARQVAANQAWSLEVQ